MIARLTAPAALVSTLVIGVACGSSGEGGREVPITQSQAGCSPKTVEATAGEKLNLVVKNENTRIWESGNASYRGSKLVLCISMQSTHVTTTMQLKKPTHMASLLNYAPCTPVLSLTYINTSGKTRRGYKSVLNVNR